MATDNTKLSERLRQMSWRRRAFYLVVLLFLVLMLALTGPFLLAPFLGWFMADMMGAHFIHDMAAGTMLFVATLGVLLQLYRPEQRVAPIQMAVGMIALLIISMALSPEFFPPAIVILVVVLLVALLHPAGRELVQYRTDAADRWLLALAAVAALPLLAYGYFELLKQGGTPDEHVLAGHYSGMAVFSLAVLFGGLVAANDVSGRRYAAWATGLLIVVFGLGSVLYPQQPSSVGTLGALAVIWGVAFIAVFEYRQARADRGHPGTEPETSVSG